MGTTKLVVLCFILAALVMYLQGKERIKWKRYKTNHSCKLLATENKSYIIDGIIVQSVSGRTAWLCDDIEIFWKFN